MEAFNWMRAVVFGRIVSSQIKSSREMREGGDMGTCVHV